MPFGDPHGSYASGGAVNQGGPSGSNSPGNMGHMGGGSGSNVNSTYAGSRPWASSYTIPFGWQPYNDGTLQQSADVWEAFNNPAQWNYTDNPMIGRGGLSGVPGGFGNPRGAGGSNSGQGGMGSYNGTSPWAQRMAAQQAARRRTAAATTSEQDGMGANGILAALAGHNFNRRNTPRRKSGRSLTSYLKENDNASR